MAEILPFRAWRYNNALSEDIESLTSPLFDVVSEEQRKELLQHPYNSIGISVPKGPQPFEKAAKTVEKWKSDGILVRDPLPGIYVYYQYFKLPGIEKEFCRKGFICHLRIYDWDKDNVLLRHENTMPRSVNDRVDLLESTQLNVSPTHGLYSDPDFELETIMDRSIQSPIYETEDYQGVRDVLSVIHDQNAILQFVKILKDRQVILADGHHRYAGSLAYKQKIQKENPSHSGEEGYNFHMMYLTNLESDDLRILPTHRLLHGLDKFEPDDLLSRLEKFFTIKPVTNAHDLEQVILGKKWAFGLLFRNKSYKLQLIPEALAAMDWDLPDQIKALDITVMHYFIIEKAIGIAKDQQTLSTNISFDRSFPDCLAKVITKKAQLALITNEVSMAEVLDVCNSGYTMPQKATYFHPKVVCGFLFGSIKEDEFEYFTDSSL